LGSAVTKSSLDVWTHRDVTWICRRIEGGTTPTDDNARFGYTYSPDEGKLLVEPKKADVRSGRFLKLARRSASPKR